MVVRFVKLTPRLLKGDTQRPPELWINPRLVVSVVSDVNNDDGARVYTHDAPGGYGVTENPKEVVGLFEQATFANT